MISTRESANVPNDPGSSIFWAVPDTWDVRAGAALALWPGQGLSATVGVRFDGTRRKDLIGGGGTADRLPATAGFLDPGMTFTRGSHTLSLSFPLQVYKNFPPSLADQVAGDGGGGGLSRSMILTSYSYRF